MKINCYYKPFSKYVLFFCLAFICSTNLVYSQTNSDDSYDLESALKNHNKVFTEKKDTNSSIELKKIEPWTFSGKVKSIIDENNIVIKHKNREIMVKFLKKEASEFKVEDEVRVTCIPYRENPNKVILAKGMKIKKADGQTDYQSNSDDAQNSQNQEFLQKESQKRRSSGMVTRPQNSSKSFRMNRNCVISGEITEIVSDDNILIKFDGREILVKFRRKVASNFEVGDKVSVTCNAYRENPNGVILANGGEIEKEE